MLAWYVAVTKPFAGFIAEEHLKRQPQFAQVFNPKELVTSVQRGQRTTTERPYMPGYIFVQFDIEAEPIEMIIGGFKQRRNWRSIYQTRGIETVLGQNSLKPSPINQDAMEVLFSYCVGDYVKAKEADQALRDLQVGQMIQVKEGPFQGFRGPVHWTQGDRVKALLTFLGATRPIPFGAHEVEAVA